ncbi:MAG: nucleotidyl transferase AbiEii/AbiGii toxin family protein [Solirubrobacteraceae bacterium]
MRWLCEAASYDAGDFFAFEVASGRLVDADHPLERAYSIPVVTRVGETEFARFSIDLALPRDDIDVEWIEPQTLVTGEAAVDNIPRVATLTFPAQLADKVCALYERHGEGAEHSSRARDLADIAMIASQVDIDGTELAGRVRAEEQRRRVAGTLTEPLPNTLTLPPVQQYDWSRRWTKATRGAPITFEDALALASALMDPILDGRAADARWDATQRACSHR